MLRKTSGAHNRLKASSGGAWSCDGSSILRFFLQWFVIGRELHYFLLTLVFQKGPANITIKHASNIHWNLARIEAVTMNKEFTPSALDKGAPPNLLVFLEEANITENTRASMTIPLMRLSLGYRLWLWLWLGLLLRRLHINSLHCGPFLPALGRLLYLYLLLFRIRRHILESLLFLQILVKGGFSKPERFRGPPRPRMLRRSVDAKIGIISLIATTTIRKLNLHIVSLALLTGV
mmetsp:Transcript_29942/g.60774  ORF Transcript_29942/g.60774 Transcript_29942/m.60774 type:complete len:234 (+) Transcript_29942:1722-2423(+)